MALNWREGDMDDTNLASTVKDSNIQTKIVDTWQRLLPWWSLNEIEMLKSQTEQNPKSYLDSFYLFPLDEITIDSNCDDIPKFINERFYNILAAAYHSNVSVTLILSSRNGRTGIYLGFKSEIPTQSDPELFESIMNGILPGGKISFKQTVNISSLAKGCQHGGIITGIPVIRNEDGKQKFNLASIARSLYGKNYVIAIISRPVYEKEMEQPLNKLIEIRDALHALSKQTIEGGKTTGNSVSNANTKTIGSSKTSGWAPSLILISHSNSKAKTESASKGKTTSSSENQSRSISIEKQNGFALELEKVADSYIERMIKGFNSGYWETTITFATKDEFASKILAGTFVGELSKPSDKLLPPPRFYLSSLKDRTLFIPKAEISSSNSLFPKTLASYITGEELSMLSSPPFESIPGYEIQKMPKLALTDIGNESEIEVGSIVDHGNPINKAKMYLSRNDLNKHLFICGLTGSGKTTTVKHILKNLFKKYHIPFLVLESAKRDYRQLLADEVFKDNLNIFTIGDETVSPIRFNPFYIQKGVHPLEHIDHLKAIFNASFSLYGPMPSILEKCLHEIYVKKGWDLTLGIHPFFLNKNGEYDESRYQFDEHYYCFPTLTELKEEINRYVKTELGYRGEVQDNIRAAIITRLESLSVGAKGLMFNTYDFFPINELLSKNTIFEMESLSDDDDKAFFLGLILVLIREYRQKENPAINPGAQRRGLQHALVIEEAHRLLKNVETERYNEMMGNPKGKAIELFSNILAEMRSMGQGVAVVEQIPSKISPDVIKNSNTKIVHRLVSKDDQSLLAGSLGLDDHEALYLNRLKTGHALCFKEGMGRPLECVVSNDVDSYAISDNKVKKLMSPINHKYLHTYKTYDIDARLGNEGKELCIKFFNSLILIQTDALEKLIYRAKDEMQRLCRLKNIPYEMDDSLFGDYFSLQVLKLLSKGIYSSRNPIPHDLKAKLYEVASQPSATSHKQLIDLLSEFWKPTPARSFVEDVIENLSLHYLYQHDLEETVSEIQSVVSSFLLSKDEKSINKISQNIKKKMEDLYA